MGAFQDFINTNSISAISASFFTMITGIVSLVLRESYKNRRETEAAKRAVTSVKQDVSTVVDTIGNGTVDSMNDKLDAIVKGQLSLERSFRDHMQWHVEKGPK